MYGNTKNSRFFAEKKVWDDCQNSENVSVFNSTIEWLLHRSRCGKVYEVQFPAPLLLQIFRKSYWQHDQEVHLDFLMWERRAVKKQVVIVRGIYEAIKYHMLHRVKSDNAWYLLRMTWRASMDHAIYTQTPLLLTHRFWQIVFHPKREARRAALKKYTNKIKVISSFYMVPFITIGPPLIWVIYSFLII